MLCIGNGFFKPNISSTVGRLYKEGDVMRDRGLEIAWVDDPVELFFLQIQGSGRIRLPNGSYLRVGYRGANGHDYRSVGVELVRRGVADNNSIRQKQKVLPLKWFYGGKEPADNPFLRAVYEPAKP